MQTVSFWQAWGLWFDGRSVADYRMWGLPVLWWGRFGKLGQFTGGLAAIIDIVGVARITGWGERLRARPIAAQRQTFTDAVRRSRRIFTAVYRSGKLEDEPDAGSLEPEARRVRWIALAGSVVLVALSQAWYFGWELQGETTLKDIGWFIVTLSGVFGLVVWPPLVLLRGPQPDRSLRVIGVLLVVAGFGLDLLAS